MSTVNVKVDGQHINVRDHNSSVLLQSFCDRYASEAVQSDAADIELDNQNGLSIIWHKGQSKPLTLKVDVQGFLQRQYSFPAMRKTVFNQAIGRKSKRILDLTGGFGSDALLLCSQGYEVDIVERHPLMALLLQDAMDQVAQSEWARVNQVRVPEVHNQDSGDFLLDADLNQVDCLYLDPMFPAKRKKSAASNKEMQFLQNLLGQGSDSDALLIKAIQSPVKRVVVKRPKHADPLLNERCKPSERFSGKLVHYDVYLGGSNVDPNVL